VRASLGDSGSVACALPAPTVDQNCTEEHMKCTRAAGQATKDRGQFSGFLDVA
jgi:hypothetical protein